MASSGANGNDILPDRDIGRDSVSIENVSLLLGHSSVRITERQYKPWVKTLQRKLEDEVRQARA